jgi:hypothetical protein
VCKIKKLTKAAKAQPRAVEPLTIMMMMMMMIINCPLVIATSVVRFALQSEN